MLASTLDGLPEPPMISADVTGVNLPSASTTCVMQGTLVGVTACFIALPHIVLTYAVDLKGQLACWRQADALHVLVSRVHMAKHAQHEAASLATAGLGLSQQVAVPGCGVRNKQWCVGERLGERYELLLACAQGW